MTTERTGAITMETVICQTNSHVSANVDGEIAILSIENGNYYHDVASRIWNSVVVADQADGCRLTDVCSSIVAEYEVSQDDCILDTLRLVREMLEYGLLEVRETN